MIDLNNKINLINKLNNAQLTIKKQGGRNNLGKIVTYHRGKGLKKNINLLIIFA